MTIKQEHMRYLLISTDHLTDDLLFRDNEDFRAGMNYTAVVSHVLDVHPLAFILMSNHVHYILYTSKEMAKTYMDRLKQLYGRYFQNKYGINEFLRKQRLDIRELKMEDESLHRGIAYLQMNCVAANITPHPFLYSWGTGSCFFQEARTRGTPLSDFSRRKAIRLLHSNIRLPGNYRMGEDGYILPQSYVPVQWVESLFRSARRYSYFLNTSSKARLRIEKDAAPAFRDQVILEAMTDLCHSLYRCHSPRDLDRKQNADLLRQLYRRFNPDVNQLARVTGTPYSEIAASLDDFE